MTQPLPLTVLLKWGALALAVLGVFGAAFVVARAPDSFASRLWARYVAHLDLKLRLMFVFVPAVQVVVGQVVGVFAILLVHVLVDLPMWWAFIALAVVIPPWWIERMRQQRILAIEAQLDAFLLALANALKATPSLGDAFISLRELVPAPLGKEIELAVKRLKLGASLEQALLHMAGRVGSRQLDTALSAVLIGRQIGGNLPQALETTAGNFREMARLEGFVRSKTAEGRAQLWVLAVFPFLLVYALNAVRPGYFDPLTESIAGYGVVFVAALAWVGSLLAARKVLAVDV